jgi:hypothetical protein
MSLTRQKFLLSILDLIEECESKLLVWGLVDGYIAESELNDLISNQIDSALEKGFDEFYDSTPVIKELLDEKLIVEAQSNSESKVYRSRMAETVRLLQRLRQVFPKHAKRSNGWLSAPSLVADFRFQRRQRKYPKRDIDKSKALETINSFTKNPHLITASKALLPSNPNFKIAGFQLRSFERIIRGIEESKAIGTIVCAGTGSGKTLAFYLPALSSIVRHLLTNSKDKWVKSIAIYPRSELLKDQLGEVISRCESLRGELPNISIRVGALYGDIPNRLQDVRTGKSKWRKEGDKYICPFLKCVKCNHELRLSDSEIESNKELLTCSNEECKWSIDGTKFPFTRNSIASNPPDILFTTTEMLNQRLADNRFCHLFGIGPNCFKPPELVLLDEVHTYEGRHGAQVSYLLRRWSHLVAQPLRFVGLSATLKEAPSFLSSLTGTWQSYIEEISPFSEELESEGAEYLIALRGDPVSKAALLSTTIQTTMLLERSLDPKTPDPSKSISKGTFGQKTFAFTDDLDVTNRLYFGLLSAEGRNSQGRPDIRNAPNGGLAALRKRSESNSRYSGGQDWRAIEEIGHDLSERLNIDRVSSQDRGINNDADVIIATAALEVGYDDPKVGAVIQHKAPKGMAGFLQRKGRAGRLRGMRPWTAIVLSDYGRDRAAYQGYELLFDPELRPRTLPTSNRYITRMQSVYSTMDYLGKRLQENQKGSVWTELARPSKNAPRTNQLIKEIRTILETPYGAQNLERHLQRSLKISAKEASALLWEYPRPLMTVVLPTALRRLTSGWSLNNQIGTDYQVRNNPLPEFIPASLFADLNLTEVEIQLPQNPNNQYPSDSNINFMPIFSALREFTPGRVSRRFGVEYRSERYWICPDETILTNGTQISLPISEIGDFHKIGKFSYVDQANFLKVVTVYDPRVLKPTMPSKNIGDTSNGQLKWHSQFVEKNQPTLLTPPNGSIWANILPTLGFFSHSSQNPIEIRRFTTGSKAEIGLSPTNKVNVEFAFTNEEENVAVGTSYQADGIRFETNFGTQISLGEADAPKWRSLRTIKYFHAAWKGQYLKDVTSPFIRKWLAEIFLSSLSFEAIQLQVSLEQAAQLIIDGKSTISLNEVLEMLFQSQVDTDQADDSTDVDFGSRDKLRTELDELLKKPDILLELQTLSTLLWEQINTSWTEWLNEVYQSTLGAAILKTITDLCPSINSDDLSLDLIPKLSNSEVQNKALDIWITEKTPGGSGLIEEFLIKYSEDPRRFFSMVRASLEIGEFELIDYQLNVFTEKLNTLNSPINTSVQDLRSASTLQEIDSSYRALRKTLINEGLSPFHGFMVSLNNRVLKSGSNPGTDKYIFNSIQKWDKEEARLGIEIDLRVISYLLSQTDEIDSLIGDLDSADSGQITSWRMSAIYGLLWGRGREIRSTSLLVRNPFVELPPVERLLVIDSINDERLKVSVESSDWLEKTTEYLAQGRLVTLTCKSENRNKLGLAINSLITHPIESDYLYTYARLQGVRQNNQIIEADIELLEAIQ